MAAIAGYDEELTEYSVPFVLDCNDKSLNCSGGWMLPAMDFISRKGIVLKDEYRDYTAKHLDCQITDEELSRKKHISDFGYVEKDARYNNELKA